MLPYLRDNRFLSPAILLGVVIALGIWMPSNFGYRVATLVWTSALASIGLNLLMGYAGQVSLGHAGFFGIGAYAVAVLPAKFSLNSWLSLIAGSVASGLLAYIVGTPILRLKGYYLAIATLGLGILIAMVLNNEGWLTGGPDGIQVPRPMVFGWRLRGLEAWYWITGGVTVVGAWLASNILASSAGRAMRALQDSETAAHVAGIDVARVKLIAFVISAVYASIAGSCFAFSAGLITPEKAGFLYSVELVTMVVIGGMGSILGSVVGAAVLIILPQLLASFQDYEQILLGLLMMVVMIFLRAGIVPSLASWAVSWRR
jgi:branched-chain amino acid transport system permease protein